MAPPGQGFGIDIEAQDAIMVEASVPLAGWAFASPVAVPRVWKVGCDGTVCIVGLGMTGLTRWKVRCDGVGVFEVVGRVTKLEGGWW